MLDGPARDHPISPREPSMRLERFRGVAHAKDQLSLDALAAKPAPGRKGLDEAVGPPGQARRDPRN